jgi:hypothetical protein
MTRVMTGSGHDPKKNLGHDPTSVMTQPVKTRLGHDPKKINWVMTVTQVVIKFLNTNYIFLGILGRPGHDPQHY